MTEEEKQERSDKATADDIYDLLNTALENLVEVYSIATRWRKDRPDVPVIPISTKATVDLIRQYGESVSVELSQKSIRKIK